MQHKHDFVAHSVTDDGQLRNHLLLSTHVMGCQRAMQVAHQLAIEHQAEGRAVSIVHLIGEDLDAAGAVYQEVVSV